LLVLTFTLCRSGTPQRYLESALGEVYTALVSSRARVGVWGNSEANNVNQWIEVKLKVAK
jgi:hypothetical protein